MIFDSVYVCVCVCVSMAHKGIKCGNMMRENAHLETKKQTWKISFMELKKEKRFASESDVCVCVCDYERTANSERNEHLIGAAQWECTRLFLTKREFCFADKFTGLQYFMTMAGMRERKNENEPNHWTLEHSEFKCKCGKYIITTTTNERTNERQTYVCNNGILMSYVGNSEYKNAMTFRFRHVIVNVSSLRD